MFTKKRFQSVWFPLTVYCLWSFLLFPIHSYASAVPSSHSALEKAVEVANASLEHPTPEGFQKGVNALNAVQDEDDFAVSQKMQVLQMLLDSAIMTIHQGFDQYPVPVRQMTDDLSAYQSVLTHTNLPKFNHFAKTQLDDVQATIEALPHKPVVSKETSMIPHKEKSSSSRFSLLPIWAWFVVGIGFLAGGCWGFRKPTKNSTK